MSRYSGRRNFSSPVKAQELDEALEAVARSLDQDNPGPRKWKVLSVVHSPSGTVNASASLDCCLPVDTNGGGTCNVILPRPDSRLGGRELLVIRRSASGVVNLVPSGGSSLDESTVATALPTTVGAYLVMFDGQSFWRLRA